MTLRRRALFGMLALVLASTGCAPEPAPTAPSSATPPTTTAGVDLEVFREQIQDLEERYGANVGVAVHDANDDRTFGYGEDTRFAFASTLKAFVAAAFLAVTTSEERDEHTMWTQSDLDAAGYSPVTTEHLDTGLTLNQLAEAAVRDSDNAATNIVMRHLGGPEAVTDALRHAGDDVTVVTNYEPELNITSPDSTDNTTTPAAFTAALSEVILGDYLSGTDRSLLIDWMTGNATGDALIRAGASTGWVIVDKSGGSGNIRNDIAVAFSPSGRPYVISVLTQKRTDEPYDNELIADVAAAVFAAVT